MALYVSNSWRKVKFKLWNKLINAAAAATARAARSRQRTPACASRQGAPRLTNSLLSPRCAHKLIPHTGGGGIGTNELHTRCLPFEAEKEKGIIQ